LLIAIDENDNRVRAIPGRAGRCPVCDTEVIPKCGAIKPWHWAHRTLDTCDTWSEGETDWHLGWKQFVADINPNCVERTITEGGKRHRADIDVPRFGVIEIQHSSISAAEIIERENFYGRMIWIFDARDAWRKDRLELCTPIRSGGYRGFTFRWKRGRKTLKYVRRPLWLDLGTTMLRVDDIDETCSGCGHIVEKDDMKRMIARKIREGCYA